MYIRCFVSRYGKKRSVVPFTVMRQRSKISRQVSSPAGIFFGWPVSCFISLQDKLFQYNIFVCHRYIYKGEEREIDFYRCPNPKLYSKRSAAQLVNRKGFKVTKFTKVCSNHFSAAKPTKQDPLPSLYLKGYLPNEQYFTFVLIWWNFTLYVLRAQ